MPIPWEKVMPHRPQMLQTARGWYEKWIRGERASANDAAGTVDAAARQFEDTPGTVDAYAEPVSIEDVVEVKETTKDVASRLEALEFAGMAQAETIKNLTDQGQSLARHLSDLQGELHAVDQRLQDARANAEGHRASMESLEQHIQRMSADLSGLRSRANMALSVAVIGVVASAVAIGLILVR